MSNFKFDEEIEVSYYENFYKKEKGMFQCDLSRSKGYTSGGSLCVINTDGKLCRGDFGRKLALDNVIIYIDDPMSLDLKEYTISKELADKIQSGVDL